MIYIKVWIQDEYSKLRKVVVSSAKYYDSNYLAMNNETVKYYANHGDVPRKSIILEEQKTFWTILKNLGVEVIEANQVLDAKGQMFTRDLAFVIGDRFFISNMKKENRKNAINGWEHIIRQIDRDKVIKVPSNIYLEGGDVLVDHKIIYVGISERTNQEGVEFLKNVLGNDYTVVPLILKPKFLHLDVVLTIVHPDLVLVYKEGLEEESYQLLEKYHKIELTEKEQFELATNVFVVDSETIVMNSKHSRIANELKKFNINSIKLDMSETAKLGGAFRCTTCPLERIEVK